MFGSIMLVLIFSLLSILSQKDSVQGIEKQSIVYPVYEYLNGNVNQTNQHMLAKVSLSPSSPLENLNPSKSRGVDWWEPYVEKIAQPFTVWNGTQWCYDEVTPKDGKKSQGRGLMLSKIFKAGSSTAAGVTLRIAHRMAHRKGFKQNPLCLSYYSHQFSLLSSHSLRDPSQSFLWATVRQPHSRANSAFFFFKKGGRKEQMIFLNKTSGNQLRQMRKRGTDKPNKLRDGVGLLKGGLAGLPNSIIVDNPQKLAYEHIQKQVLQFYDFVAVTERWQESMVVMKMLMGVNVQYTDFVVLKAKEAGTKSNKNQKKKTCNYIPVATTTPEIDQYLETTYRQNNPDYLLYAAVNRSLDLTIDILGRERVEEGVRHLKDMQALAQQECLSQAIFPCSANGTWQPAYKQDCYYKDFGCGYPCLDQVLEKYTF